MKIKIAAIFSMIALVLNAHAGWLTDLILPSLTTAQKEWKMYERDVVADLPKGLEAYPLTVISDGYKMIETYREPEVRNQTGNTRAAFDAVRWGWQLTVKNNSTTTLSVKVDYQLMDTDDFVLTYRLYPPSKLVAPGDTVTFKETETMPYDTLKRVTQSNFKLNYSTR